MLNKVKKSNNKGFTIIEVMIVLAIAGLIILVVLLAVPALQRNSRNTAIKNDASAVAAAISEYRSNNDGQNPSDAVADTTNGVLTVSGGGTSAEGKVQTGTQVSVSTAPGSDAGVIQVRIGQKCSAANSFTVNPSTRAAAILYNIETSSGVAPRCIDA